MHSLEILLVEDNINDAELTIRALKKCHLANNLVHLRNGEEALNYLSQAGQEMGVMGPRFPKVILLDLKMPKVDGLEVLLRVRENEMTRTIPVVVLTSSREDPDIEAAYRLGANSYVVKPVEFDKFVEAVSQLGFYWLLLNQPPVHQSESMS